MRRLGVSATHLGIKINTIALIVLIPLCHPLTRYAPSDRRRRVDGCSQG